MKTQLNPDALYWAQFNRFALRLPGSAVDDIAQSGRNDEAVSYWTPRIRFDETNLRGEVQSTPEAIAEELLGCGGWTAEQLEDEQLNRQRIVWQAAWNIAEDEEPDCSEPLVRSGEVGPFADLGI